LLGCLLLIIPLMAALAYSVSKSAAQSPGVGIASGHRQAYQAISDEGTRLFGAGRYEESLHEFEKARRFAISNRDQLLEGRALNNEGGCEYAMHQYRTALGYFLEAQRLTVSAGDPAAAAPIDANIAGLYGQLGEVDAAAEWMLTAIHRLNTNSQGKYLPQFQIEMGSFRARQDRMTDAEQYFRDGIRGADRYGNNNLYATGFHRLGEEFLRRRDYPKAERALLEAYRLRQVNGLPLIQSFQILGELKLQQGDTQHAAEFLDRAVELAADPHSTIPLWQIFDSRGRTRLAQNRLPEALADLRIAVRLARIWRWSAPGDDFAHMGSGHVLAPVYSALIETANRLSLETGDATLARETFEAAEENRAAGLRRLAGAGSPSPDLPREFWNAIARLERAEVAALRENTPAAQETVEAARAEVVRMETALPKQSRSSRAGLLARLQPALDSDTVLLSYQLGSRVSWLWALDRGGLALYPLGPRAEIEQKISLAAEALRHDSPEYPARSAALYGALFGPLPGRLARKTRWLLALDQSLEQPLFDVPVAALVENAAGAPAYVAERHAIEVIPGAANWLESAAVLQAPGGAFVGIGDAIYNTADPRAVGRHSADRPAISLPRLALSAAELDACARVWRGDHLLLEGEDASREKLAQALQRNPAVVHFATHFLESPDHAGSGLIALSLSPQNEPGLLQPVEIANWQIRAGVVVLSGCHSAAAKPYQSSGHFELTRAWLMAGARAVVASRWDTPDDEGPLFRQFYAALGAQARPDASQALRAAQREMIRAGGWRAQPRYWGAYFVVGNQ
jgi:CHAT domain-containing protein